MKPMQIDFAPRRGVLEAGSDKRHRPLWLMLCVLGLVLLVASFSAAWKLQRERSKVNERVATLQAELNVSDEGAAQDESANADSAESVLRANMHLNYPWATMLGVLEQNMRPQITLISLEMGVLRQSNKLVVEAGDVAAALSFLDSLREEPQYATLILTRQETVVGEGGTRMRFTFEAPIVQAESATKKAGAR